MKEKDAGSANGGDIPPGLAFADCAEIDIPDDPENLRAWRDRSAEGRSIVQA
jgi:hypothetical protein